MHSFIVLALSALALPSNSPAGVYIAGFSYGGTGCPQNSVGYQYNPDNTAVTLIFDKFVATDFVDATATDKRKACQLTVDIRVPQGWSYSIATVDYRGLVDLPVGGTAEQTAIYYFQSNIANYKSKVNFVGPVSKDYNIRNTVDLGTTVWSECNAVIPVNVKTEVRVSVPKGETGTITTDTIDAKVKQIYGLQWRRC